MPVLISAASYPPDHSRTATGGYPHAPEIQGDWYDYASWTAGFERHPVEHRPAPKRGAYNSESSYPGKYSADSFDTFHPPAVESTVANRAKKTAGPSTGPSSVDASRTFASIPRSPMTDPSSFASIPPSPMTEASFSSIPPSPMTDKSDDSTSKNRTIYSPNSQKCVSELLAYNFKQFGGLIKVVPLVFADANCTLKDLGQLVARAHFWLSGLKGRDKGRQTTFHNRFMESFFRCWYQNSRGLSIVSSAKSRMDKQEECDFFVAQVTELLRIADNGGSNTESAPAQGPQYLVSILDDLRASGLVATKMPALPGDDRTKENSSQEVERNTDYKRRAAPPPSRVSQVAERHWSGDRTTEYLFEDPDDDGYAYLR